MYRMNFNKEGPIDPKLFNMCEEAHYYQEMMAIIDKMSRIKIDISQDLDAMAEELGNYFDA